MLHARRTGFTLVETIVAVLLLAVGLLALEGALATSIRSLAYSWRASAATSAAESARERSVARCTAGSGIDTIYGAVVTWSAARRSASIVTHESSQFSTAYGTRAESYDGGAPCP